jgi:protein-S-isoprenylcysteine O-methyltransferase Ste14
MVPGNIASAYRAAGDLWLLWVVSWLLASRWSARTVKTPQPGSRTLEILLVMGGAAVLTAGGGLPTGGELSEPIYALGTRPAWLLVGLVACGFLLCWWARLHLGQMWSMAITLKQDHQIIDTGPYALVRHPIYTGLLLAIWATAAIAASELAFAGAAMMTLGIYLKARGEEILLTAELGPRYEAYRRRVPMLVPGIPRAPMQG